MLAVLERYPEVCRLCLQSKPESEMASVDGIVPEFDALLADLLSEFYSDIPEDINGLLPLFVCEQCLQEFTAAYKVKRRMYFLVNFQVAFTQYKQGQTEALIQMYEDHSESMGAVFRDLGLIDKNHELSWEDITELGEPESPTAEIIMCEEDSSNAIEVELLQESVVGEEVDQLEVLEIEYLDEEEIVQNDEYELPEKRSSRKRKKRADTVATISRVKREDPLSCEKCRFTTYFDETFEDHQRKHREEEARNEWICNIDDCRAEFTSSELLMAHKSEVHNYSVCGICGLALKSKYTLEVHIRRHKGETRFFCEYCPSSFHTSQEHKLHLNLVHVSGEAVSCEVCGLEFRNSICLKRHLQSHSEVRSYQCPHCKKSFKTTMHLHRHKHTVHMKVRFECDHCGTSYGRRDKLRMHLERAHNIQSYFLCEICLKSFPEADQLEQHKEHHANPKPLECGTCLVAFLSADEFEQHTCITYREDYVCCGRNHKYHTFYNKHQFLAHGLRTNARVKPAADKLIANVRAARKQEERCNKCGEEFATRKLKHLHQLECAID